jgi:hypothetical protein
MNRSPILAGKLRKWLYCISFLLAVLILGASGLHYFIRMYPDRGAQLHFSAKSRASSWTFGTRFLEIRKRLLQDSRVIGVDQLPQDLRAYYSRNGAAAPQWPILGAENGEFTGLSVWPEETAKGAGLRVNFRSKDMYSKKIRDMREVISTAIGEKEMSDIEVWIDEVEIMPRLGDGST